MLNLALKVWSETCPSSGCHKLIISRTSPDSYSSAKRQPKVRQKRPWRKPKLSKRNLNQGCRGHQLDNRPGNDQKRANGPMANLWSSASPAKAATCHGFKRRGFEMHRCISMHLFLESLGADSTESMVLRKSCRPGKVRASCSDLKNYDHGIMAAKNWLMCPMFPWLPCVMCNELTEELRNQGPCYDRCDADKQPLTSSGVALRILP